MPPPLPARARNSENQSNQRSIILSSILFIYIFKYLDELFLAERSQKLSRFHMLIFAGAEEYSVPSQAGSVLRFPAGM